MDVEVYGTVRGSWQPNLAERDESQLLVNNRGELLVANAVPSLASLTSMGESYWASTTTAAAPVTSIPTTASLLLLQNGEPDNGKSYVIDSVFVIQVAATAAVQSVTILANNAFDTTSISRIAGSITVRNLRGGQTYKGNGRVSVGQAIDSTNGIAANWMPVGNSAAASNTTQVGTAIDVPLNGMIIIPPKGQIALSAIAGAATASSLQLGIRWHEMILPVSV